jgi:hypothetical protein
MRQPGRMSAQAVEFGSLPWPAPHKITWEATSSIEVVRPRRPPPATGRPALPGPPRLGSRGIPASSPPRPVSACRFSRAVRDGGVPSADQALTPRRRFVDRQFH